MAKMRTYTFVTETETKTIDALSLKRAVKSFQGGAKEKVVRVEWTAKKGGEYEKLQNLPMGRSKKIGK